MLVSSLQRGKIVCQAKQYDMEEFDPNNIWQVRSTPHGLSGDLMLCKGCYLESYEVPIGYSYSEKKNEETNSARCCRRRGETPEAAYSVGEARQNAILQWLCFEVLRWLFFGLGNESRQQCF